jgi:hypothetical protein
VDADAHLAAGRDDVDRAVLVQRQVRAEPGRRRGELLDLFLQSDDLLARFAEGRLARAEAGLSTGL